MHPERLYQFIAKISAQIIFVLFLHRRCRIAIETSSRPHAGIAPAGRNTWGNFFFYRYLPSTKAKKMVRTHFLHPHLEG